MSSETLDGRQEFPSLSPPRSDILSINALSYCWRRRLRSSGLRARCRGRRTVSMPSASRWRFLGPRSYTPRTGLLSIAVILSNLPNS